MYTCSVSIGFYAIEVIAIVVVVFLLLFLFASHFIPNTIQQYDDFSRNSFAAVRIMLFIAKQNKWYWKKSDYANDERKKRIH